MTNKKKDTLITADEARANVAEFEALSPEEQEAKKLAQFDAQVEAAVRQQLAENPTDQALNNLIAVLDNRRAKGETVILRIDDVTKKIAVVQFAPVTVSLAELEAAADLAEEVLADEAAQIETHADYGIDSPR